MKVYAKFTFISLCFLSLMILMTSVSVYANNLPSDSNTKNSKDLTQPPFIISYVDHPSITSYYLPLIEQAYRSIGIYPEFVLINDKRALRLLNNGEIDADVVKTLEFIDDYPNIITVPTPMSKIEARLVCQQKLPCDLSVFKISQASLGIIAANEFYAKLLADAKLNIVEVSSFEQLQALFNQQKLDYIITVFDLIHNSNTIDLTNSYLIEEKIGFHLLNQQHQHLAVELAQAIEKIMANKQTIH